MQYRKMENLNVEVSALGFGIMRLPLTSDNPEDIDEKEAMRMIRYAIDQGVNYVDTAYPYHRQASEPFVAKVLKDGYREKVFLATKMPSWLIKEEADFEKYFTEQLERLETDHIDFYLLHALNQNHWDNYKKLNVFKWLDEKKAQGKIRFAGFSFHDKIEVFKEIVDGYKWDFCQIQYNYMDIENQAGTEGLQYAAEKGLGVVVMEPILGGGLVNPPDPIVDIWSSAPVQRKPADWALQWLWNQPEVSVVLSGMSTMQQVEENVQSADQSGIGKLSNEELSVVDAVREKFNHLRPIPCTRCEYCLPCPQEINIPSVLWRFNRGVMYDKMEQSKWIYLGMEPEGKRAEDCIACRECESKCPQSIPISDWMAEITEVFINGKEFSGSLN